MTEALRQLAGGTGRIYAEVKGFRELEDVDRMAKIAQDEGVLDRTVFIAMNWTLLDRMRTTMPGLSIGYIVDDEGQVKEARERARGDERAMIDFDAKVLAADPSIVPHTRAAGIDLAVWTVDDPEEASRLHDLGVRRFTTNQVETLLSWKQAQS